MYNGELRLSSRAGGVYMLREVLPEGGVTDVVRAEGASRMERALRGLEVGLRHNR